MHFIQNNLSHFLNNCISSQTMLFLITALPQAILHKKAPQLFVQNQIHSPFYGFNHLNV